MAVNLGCGPKTSCELLTTRLHNLRPLRVCLKKKKKENKKQRKIGEMLKSIKNEMAEKPLFLVPEHKMG